ncbi:uncharacterized protein LOC62_03G003804 [Vanrija pseudolonga]|uniref:DUF4246 domain-containing protein n=1 Tax=Vanrija pseudolonga TaxID=143232 RepID=A0AAF0Y569_9TREE|nr:hypothetical protein LOC62_03G003804 [Vanrija pseudolonga]
MLQFMANVTDQPDWEKAVFDDEEVGRYSQYRYLLAARRSFDLRAPVDDLRSAFEGAESLANTVGFSDIMFNWCIWELGMRAKASQENNGIVALFETSAAAFKLDLPEDFRLSVAEALVRLEAEALEDKGNRWQPGHNDTNLKIVQPSLYAVDFEQTHVLQDRIITVHDCLESIGSGQVIAKERRGRISFLATRGALSTRFQWLPTDVTLDAEGKSHIIGYLNNIHPVRHAGVYRMVEKLLDKALPLFAAAYDSVKTKDRLVGSRFPTDFWRCTTPSLCGSDKAYTTHDPMSGGCKAANYLIEKEDATHQEQKDWFARTHPFVQPEPLSSPEHLDAFSSTRRPFPTRLPWEGSDLQIIVSVGSILLTPDKPVYATGQFHVEGLLNERICASAIYYYDSDNITESRLGFEAAGSGWKILHGGREGPPFYRDRPLAKELYDVAESRRCSSLEWMPLGSIETRPGRLVVFPNVYAHRVEPFELVDKTRPGYRKMIAIFLVDPGTPIISTSNVPPQQSTWATREQREPNSPEMLSGAIIGSETAKERSDELLEEREKVGIKNFGNGLSD